jgi:hypothetical protein
LQIIGVDMTQDEIIEMAIEAGLDWHTGWTLDDEKPNRFETFANLVAAKEREACVNICYGWNNTTSTYIIEEIRARGEA